MMAWSVAFEQLSRDLGVDAAAALEDAEDRRLAAGAAPAPAAHPVRAEVALVDLHLACEGAFVGGQQRDASAEQGVETQHGLAVQTAELGRLGRGQIGAEASEHLPQLGLIHARVAQIAVFLKHRSTLDGARTTLSGPDPKQLAKLKKPGQASRFPNISDYVRIERPRPSVCRLHDVASLIRKSALTLGWRRQPRTRGSSRV